MGELIAWPKFVREAAEDDPAADPEALCELIELGISATLEPIVPSAALFARLQARLAQPPDRYAPFCTRLAELFDLSEEATIAELTRLAQPSVWRFAGWPGTHQVAVRGGPKVANAETLFVRFAPGTRFPRHHHLGSERTLVMEGNYTDSAGIVHRAGEIREWNAGSEHSFIVGSVEPCIFASVTFGRQFHARPLRLLARVLGH